MFWQQQSTTGYNQNLWSMRTTTTNCACARRREQHRETKQQNSIENMEQQEI